MAAENDFLPFATGVGANVITQAAYAALSATVVANGFSSGLAQSDQLNKVWRQSSFVAAAIAQYIQNQTADAVLDDGNLTEFVTNLTAAIQTGASIQAYRTIASSAAFNILLSDYAIGMQRVAAPAATTATLPSGAQIGQVFRIGDIQGNANQYPITVQPDAGHNIAGLPGGWEIVTNRGWAQFRWTGNNTWSLEL